MIGLWHRLARFVALGVCGGITAALIVLLPRRSRIMAWSIRVGSRFMLLCLGIRLYTPDGRRSLRQLRHDARRGLLVACNHLSWVDILSVQATYGPMRMVAMAEIRSWPVLNWLSGKARTIYIDRGRLLQLPDTVGRVTAALGRGETVGVFPEGATSCGRHDLRFRPALFQAAIDADADIDVISIEYRSAGEPTPQASFLRHETVWPSLWRLLGIPRPSAILRHASLTWDAGSDRRELAAAAQAVRDSRFGDA
jgi:1-acyl-sn-glycerol-3-phosphate acyltransferase